MSDRRNSPATIDFVAAGLIVSVVITALALGLATRLRSAPTAETAPTPTDPGPSVTPSLTFTPPSPTVTLTWTPLPTVTPRATLTPIPTRTPWPTTPPPTNTPRPTPTPTPYRDPLSVAGPLDINSVLPWDPSRKVTVLLMGIDRRPLQGGRSRTDTMLVMRLDPGSGVGGMVSIPRDLYVPIEGHGSQRINTAYVYGGGYLAKGTVQDVLGVPIDYYVVIDFVAFTTLVDEMGGLDVEVARAINDPTYPDHNYGYAPLFIPAGPQHMDGTLALAYARTRHGSSDYDRARRQQQVMLALRDKAVDLGMLPQLVAKAPGLFVILRDSIDTDLPFEEIVSLGLAAADIPRENIKTGVIDAGYGTPTTLKDGAQVLIPNKQRIAELVSETLP